MGFLYKNELDCDKQGPTHSQRVQQQNIHPWEHLVIFNSTSIQDTAKAGRLEVYLIEGKQVVICNKLILIYHVNAIRRACGNAEYY